MDRFLKKKEVLSFSLVTGELPNVSDFVEWRRKRQNCKKLFEQILPDGTRHGEFYKKKVRPYGKKNIRPVGVKKVTANFFMGKLHGPFYSKVEDWTGVCVAKADFIHGNIERMTISCPGREKTTTELIFLEGYPVSIIGPLEVSEIIWDKKKRKLWLQSEQYGDVEILDETDREEDLDYSIWIISDHRDALEVYIPKEIGKKVYCSGRVSRIYIPVFV